MKGSRLKCWKLLLLLWLCFSPLVVVQGGPENPQPRDHTEWDINGAGWLLNRQLTRQLSAILPKDELLASNDVEDASLILLSLMQQKGYLDAKVVTYLTGIPQTGEGAGASRNLTLTWDRSFETYLQQDMVILEVEFELISGPLFYYHSFEILDNGNLGDEFVGSFFFKTPMLFQGDRVKVFNESRFQKSCRNLESYLFKIGYQEAIVTGKIISLNFETGEVEVSVKVQKGRKHTLGSVQIMDTDVDLRGAIDIEARVGSAYSREVKQDLLKKVRNTYYEKGYPSVKVEDSVELESSGEALLHNLELHISAGKQIHVGEVRIDGIELTRESFVRKKLDLTPGSPLNPIQLDQNRLELSQTGLFDKVEVALETGEENWDVVFDLQERFPWTWDLFAGWGSYEQARMGSTLKRDNLWGQAHQLSLKGVISFKSLYGESIYTIPDIRRSGVNLNARSFYLNREEKSFDRKERGVELGLTKRFDRMRLDSSLIYTFERLSSIDRQSRNLVEDDNSSVGSIALRLTHDRRDSPISPQSGYRIYGNLEWAEPSFGGDVRYLSEELGFAQHGNFGGGLFWHFGVSHGLVYASGDSQNYIPNNKLFFPGGDDSIRGYQRGEAAPLDADGYFVGARSFLLSNVELEQYVTDTLAAVVFYDWLMASQQSVFYGTGDMLQSIGLGIRWKTVIGPVRLEYGHNLNRRPTDPSGTLHLAIGFPF